MIKIILLIFIGLVNFACIAKDISQKGYILDESDLNNISIGLTNRDNVLKQLGHPLNKSYFNENIWIYYSYKTKEVLFFKPKIKEQKILIVEFDPETEVIKNMSLYNVNSNKYESKIPNKNIEKENENFIKDILKNIGQISM